MTCFDHQLQLEGVMLWYGFGETHCCLASDRTFATKQDQFLGMRILILMQVEDHLSERVHSKEQVVRMTLSSLSHMVLLQSSKPVQRSKGHSVRDRLQLISKVH